MNTYYLTILITLLTEYLIYLPPFTYILLFNPHGHPRKYVLLFLFHRKGNKPKEVLSKLFKVTRLASVRDWTQIQVHMTLRSTNYSLHDSPRVWASCITWWKAPWAVRYSLWRKQCWTCKQTLEYCLKDTTLFSFLPYWGIVSSKRLPCPSSNMCPTLSVTHLEPVVQTLSHFVLTS